MTDLIALAKNPVPSGGAVSRVAVGQNVTLRVARWDATRGPRRGTACIFPGRGEFIEKYFETIADLRRRGYAVAILDWRGQGASTRALPDPRKGYVRSFAEYDADLLRIMKDVVLPDCPPPYIALAHSMGGNVLLRSAGTSGSWFDRMILCAPMLGIADAKVPVPQVLARLYAEIFGIGRLGQMYVPGGTDIPEESKPFENTDLTSDRARYERNKQLIDAAPELALGSPTVAWLRAAYHSQRMLMHPEFAARVRVPILLISAGKDRIVSTAAIEMFASRLKIGAHVAINGSKHEILQERDEIRQRFWAAFDAYLGVGVAAA